MMYYGLCYSIGSIVAFMFGVVWFFGCFFFFKLFNLEEVQGRKVRRLALTLAERWLLNFL